LSDLSAFDNQNLAINPKLTDYLTKCVNTVGRSLTRGEKDFLIRGYRINVINGRAFTTDDYKGIISGGSFRQLIRKLRPIIQIVIKSRPNFYKLKGLYLDEKLTKNYTELSSDQRMYAQLDILLSMVKHERPFIHDIRLSANISDLYEELVKKGSTPDKNNGMITIDASVNSLYTTKVNVSKNSMMVMIGCTYSPIEYSQSGMLCLTCHCGEILMHLKSMSGIEFQVQRINDWSFVYFHLNRDSIEHTFPKGFTLDTIIGHTAIYAKKMANGKSVIRLEDKLAPDTTILGEMDTDRFQKANEL